MTEPLFPKLKLFNQQYRLAPFNNALQMAAFQIALSNFGNYIDIGRDTHSCAHDDMIVWFRNLGFTRDERFIAACEPYRTSQVIKARLWRVYTLCWAAQSCLSVPGAYMDLGCYDGITVDIMRRYCGASDKRWLLFDTFDRHPSAEQKEKHGPELASAVAALFSDDPRFEVITGRLPESLIVPDQIAFMQIDLNSPAAELASLEATWDRVSPGGVVVLDDYGFSTYRESHDRERAFFAERGALVYECPTGQGIVIKRA